jgi:enoyl-CoA hydratase
VITTEEVAADGSVTLLRIEHGPVNALDLELCREITEHLVELRTGGPVVLTGSGRAFSAGVDLRALLDGGAPYVREFVLALDALFRVAFSLPVPVVAAVNGPAIAGGAILAAAADTVLMADGRGRIGMPELKVGVTFPQSALEILGHRAGEIALRRLVLGALTHAPSQAVELGLVDEIVDEAQLLERAVATAEEYATLIPADAFAMTKAQLRTGRPGVSRKPRRPTWWHCGAGGWRTVGPPGTSNRRPGSGDRTSPDESVARGTVAPASVTDTRSAEE